MTRPPATVLMTADTVGGVWSYALGLCAAIPNISFVLATLGPLTAGRRNAPPWSGSTTSSWRKAIFASNG